METLLFQLLTLFIILLTANVFSILNALLEAFSDNQNYLVKEVFGQDKHVWYALMRWCLWFTQICWFAGFFTNEGAIVLEAPALLIVIILLQFRWLRYGLYFSFRNMIAREQHILGSYSVYCHGPYKDGFKHNPDGKPENLLDKIIGRSYRSRLSCLWLSIGLLILLILLILNNAPE